jgi:protochlorophyllide reductase
MIVLTGATQGIGLEAARNLALDTTDRLIVGARTPDRADALREAVPPERLTVLPLDTSSLASVAAFSAAVTALAGPARLRAVACNAGLQIMGPLRRSADGYELTFATNYLGHFALVHRLLPLLADGAAIVTTASGTHNPHERIARIFGFRGGLFTDAEAVAGGILDATASEQQGALDRYATSKFCDIVFALDMARRLPAARARFIAFDPGLMPGTGLARERSAMERWGWSNILPALRILRSKVSSAARSGKAMARLLTDRSLAPESGLHIDFRLRRTEPWLEARRADLAADLYDFSARACRIQPLPRLA